MNKNEYSNQFPIKEKRVKYKHDFKIIDGYVIFNYFGQKIKFTGFEFINWLNENNFKDCFEYIVYKSYGYDIIKVPTNKNDKIIVKNTLNKEAKVLDKFPDISKPKILGIKPKMNNPIHFLEEEYVRIEDEKKEYQMELMNKIKNDMMNNEKNINCYDEFINENWLKKAALAGALATSSLSGHTQQKVDKFTEYQTKKVINQSFNSPDDVNKWLKNNLDTNYTWEISKMEVEGDTKLNIKFNAEKSDEGYNRIIFTCNKVGLKEEDKSKTKVLFKNPGSELIYSGNRFTLNKVDYQWYLIGLRINNTNYISNVVSNKKDTLIDKFNTDTLSNKSLIDEKAYKAIYNFESTKGKIIKDKNGKYIATTMEVNGKKYDVHKKDEVIKDHIKNAIGIDTWFRIPSNFRMQIFSYMFNSDSYEDKKGDRFRWLAGLSQAANPNEFGTDTTGRKEIMTNKDVRSKAINYIKSLKTEDFESHYADYLNILHSQYSSLSTNNGKEYDDAAKELSWFIRPIELDNYYKNK